MKTEREGQGPDERRAREALRSLSDAPADPGFREHLRQRFVTGAFEAERERRIVRLPIRRARPWLPMLAPAAAALLSLTLVWALDRGPRWEPAGTPPEGVLVVGDTPIPLGHGEELRRALRAGARLRLSAAGPLDLALPGQLAIQVTPGTDMVLPSAVGRWTRRRVSAEVRSGEIRVATGARFRGARLRIATPEAMVDVMGTTLAVIREPQGTCVCVMDGTVAMGPRDRPMMPVMAGRRRFVFNDGREPEHDVMRAVESVALRDFARSHAQVLERAPGDRSAR